MQSKQKVIYYTGTLINTGLYSLTGVGWDGGGDSGEGGLNLLIPGHAAPPVLT